MRTKISSALDSIADRLESRGLIKEAYEIDKIADSVEAESKCEVKDAGPKGRGLYAVQPIKTGDNIFTISATEISPEDWTLIEESKKMSPEHNLIDLYGLIWGNKHSVALGKVPYQASSKEMEILKNTKIFQKGVRLHEFNFVNHDKNPNMKETYSGGMTITGQAIRDIQPGEEITKLYNPGGRSKFC